MRIEKKYRRVLGEMADKRFPGQKEELLERAEAQYARFMSEIPDIGGKENMQFEDLNFAVVFFAFHEACGRRLTPQDLDEFAERTMVEPARRSGKLLNWNSPLMPAMAYRMYGSYKKKIDKHVSRGEWGNTWRFEINPEQHREGFAVHTRMCPSWDFVRRYGYEEFMPVLCRQDHKIAEAMQGRLVRYHTVANGDGYCDWWYLGSKTPVTQEERDYRARQEGGPL